MITFFEFWISFKYLFPKTRERFLSLITLFSFLGISLGVATLIIVMSVMNGFREELTSKILGINGHLKIQPIQSFKLTQRSELKRNILDNFKNLNVNEIILGQGLLNYKSFSSGVLLKGVDDNFFYERKIFKENLKNDSLNLFKNNEGIFIGEKLRQKLDLKIGDYITIISPDSYETILGNLPRSGSFKVVGFFSVGMYEYDTSLIFFPKLNARFFKP